MNAAEIDARLVAALPPGRLFAVGGRVRDELRTLVDGEPRPAKDLDYVVVGVELDELVARLRSLGRADIVGAAFAVVKLTLEGETVDVALPRRERSSGLGHRDFIVEWGADVPLADDLGRRDFRMNMIARGLPGGELVDPYGGARDIAARRIDVLRDEAFAEDPLRLLRACQFSGRFAFEVSPGTRAAMRAAAPLVATVSAERVRDELVKLLRGASRPSLGIELMRETGVLAFVLPELLEGWGVEQNEYHAFDVYHHALATLDATPPGDPVARLAALLHDVGKPRVKDGPHFYRHEHVGAQIARERLDALRFSATERDDVAALVRHHMYATGAHLTEAAVRRFIRRVGIEQLPRQFALRHADIAGSGLPKRDDTNERFEARVARVLAERPPLGLRDLPVRGPDAIDALVAAGRLPPGSRGGPLVGQLLRRIESEVLDDPALAERERLLQRLVRWASDPQWPGDEGEMVDGGATPED